MERRDRIVVYPSRWKMALLAFGALVFVVLGALIGLELLFGIGVFGPFDRPGRAAVGSFVGVPFFGLCLVYCVYRLIARKPSLIVGEEGIYDNASALGAGMIRWDEIEKIYAFNYLGQRMLGMIPHDAEAILARQNPVKRRIMRINTRNLGIPSTINIPQNTLPMSVDELIRRMDAYRTAPEGNYSS